METETIIIIGSFGAISLLLLSLVMVLFTMFCSLKRKVDKMQATGRIRVQKLKMKPGKNYAYQNPALSPDEELTRRGYSMYMGAEDDVESARSAERQTGGQFVEELNREIDNRQQRQSAPPFLLQAIQENRKKGKTLNPVATPARQSDTNPNFIY